MLILFGGNEPSRRGGANKRNKYLQTDIMYGFNERYYNYFNYISFKNIITIFIGALLQELGKKGKLYKF